MRGLCPPGRRMAAVAVGLALVLATGCRASPEQAEPAGDAPAAALAPALSVVATAKDASLPAFDAPDASRPAHVLANPQPDGSTLVLLVEEQHPPWLKVLLPIRPNGSTGWVLLADVTLAPHDYRIDVQLSAHKLTVWKGNDVFLEETVGVGAPATPTALGRFYTTGLFETATTQPVFGPYAYPLSGYSDVLFDFDGGEGQLGIHGTDDPSSLGRDMSHGCVRMSNAAITRLAAVLPAGVPVEIRP